MRDSRWTILALALTAAGALAQESRPTGLATPAREAALALLKAPGSPLERWDDVWQKALAAHGRVDELEAVLLGVAKGEAPEAERAEAGRGLAHVLHRAGRLAPALAAVETALQLGRTDALALRKAQLLDALDRSAEASAAYEALAKDTQDQELRARCRLRVALLAELGADPASGTPRPARSGAAAARTAASGQAQAPRPATPRPATSRPSASRPSASRPPASRPGASGPAEQPSALFAFASEAGQTQEFKNRAAMVLALLGKPKEARALFHVGGEGTELFRSELRLAEWALDASLPQDAQRHAWRARSAAGTKRDRVYALTVLVEAHRADGTVLALIDRFAAEPNLDTESRRVWIDLLRETSRVDEALALFKRSGEGAFSAEMRRELLAICRESGRDDELLKTYAELLAAEPARIEWRVGLSRYWLERGRRDEAEAVWRSFVEGAGEATRWLDAAEAARDLGLDDLARGFGERAAGLDATKLQARLFLFDFEVRRGRIDKALAQLDAFDREADKDAPQRVQLSEAYERVGAKKRAVEVLEHIREVRGKDLAEEDLEMRLAWLLSEVGDESTALERWLGLWRRVESPGRRRQVEDRLMAVASRLGKLADIAVDLEQKLAEHATSDRDASLLVRLYQKIGDPVSAAEVMEEHLKKAGSDPIATLNEKARVYLSGKDYFHFEKTVKKLIELDPENRSDHLRKLAMSNLERGRPQEARAVLVKLAEEENPSDAAEFEAGVLTLASLHEEAARTYQKGIAAHPNRIDTYLLLANSMRTLGKTEQAIGIFQYLAENADKDDLFTVAIDGILNMRAKPPQLRWALRVTLERLAARHDKVYLYQLCADLYDELKDTPGHLRSLEDALPSANEQRSHILRELMTIAQGTASGGMTLINGVPVQQRVGGDEKRRLAYGRRLIGLGEAVPPQVYLELGDAFLRSGEVSNAAKTYAMAKDVPDHAAFQRQVAESFENAGYALHALEVYERSMTSQGIDDSLLLKTAELNETLGRGARALELYRQGIELALARHPLSGGLAAETRTDPFLFRPRNVVGFDKLFTPLCAGLVANATPEQVREVIAAQRLALFADTAQVRATPPAPGQKVLLAEHPRVLHRAGFVRDLALRFGFLDEARQCELEVLRTFPDDPGALLASCEAVARHGRLALAKDLVAGSGRDEPAKSKALARIGLLADAETESRPSADVAGRMLPQLLEGDRERTIRMLRGIVPSAADAEDLPRLKLLLSAALFLDDPASVVAQGRRLVKAIATDPKSLPELSGVDAILRRIRAAVDRDAYGLVVDALLEAAMARKEVMQRCSYVLAQAQRELGRPLLSADALKGRIEECFPDQPYMVTSLLALAPQEDRLELLQRIWSRVPVSDRASIAMGLLRGVQEEPSDSVAEFVYAAFDETLDKTEPRSLVYLVNGLPPTGKKGAALLDRLVTRIARKHPGDPQLVAVQAVAAQRAGETEKAAARIRETLAALQSPPAPLEPYIVSDVVRRLVDGFVPDATETLLAQVERAEAAGTKLGALHDLRLRVCEKLGDGAGKLETLEKAVQAEPRSLERLRALQIEYSLRGETQKSVKVLERILELNDKDARTKTALVSAYLASHAAARAAAVSSDADAKKPSDAKEQKKLEPATLEALRKAVDEGRLADAAVVYRRLWRAFNVRVPGRIGLRDLGGEEPAWPGDAKAPASVRRGGLDDLRLDDDPKAGRPERKSLYDALAGLDFGLDELRRQVRGLDAAQLPRSRGLLRGLQRAEVRSRGAAAVAEWREAARTGRAGLVERALLLSYFEDHIEDLAETDRTLVAELAPAVPPADTAQLRAFARLYGKLGDTAKASRLYQWIATQATGGGRSFFLERADAADARGLIQEAKKWLAGDELIAAVAAVLERSDPGELAFERDDYLALVLETWLDVVGPEAALARCAKQIDTVLDPAHGLMRRAAIPATRILAATGNQERALKALEVVLCRVAVPPRDPMQPSFGPNADGEPRPLAVADARKLFPETADAAQQAWLARAAAAVLEWHGQRRLHEDAARVLLGCLSVRLHAAGGTERAKELVARLDAFSGVAARHLVLDLHRLLGDEAKAAAIEDELLLGRRLNPERVSEVVERVAKSDGDAKALALGAEAAEWCPHPRLVEALIAAAKRLGRADDAGRLERMRDENLAGAKALGVAW